MTITVNHAEVQERQDFASMNGVADITNEDSDSTLSTSFEEVPEPEQIVTTRTITQQPWIKSVVIGSGVFLFIGILGALATVATDALRSNGSAKIQPSQNPTVKVTEKPKQEENGETKTALALTTQKGELADLNKPKQTPSVKTTSTSAQKSVTPAQPQPQVQARVISQPLQPRIQARVVSQLLQPRIHPRTTVDESSRATQVKSTSVTSVSKPTNVDPIQQWLAVSNVGSFSAADVTTNDSVNTTGIEGGTGTIKTLSNTNNKIQSTSDNIDYNARRVLVGSRTSGKLETPIALSASNGNKGTQKYLIRLTSPLKASDGSEVLPVDSYLVVIPSGSNGGEYIQLSAIAALINVNSNTLEKPLTENSILILNKNGEALKTQSRKGSSLGGDFMTAIIAGISKAAEIENNPSSQTTITSSGYSSSTTSNDNKNLLAGFAQGSFSQVLQSMQSSNQQQIQSLQSDAKVFVIPAGTNVQVFVNQTISL